MAKYPGLYQRGGVWQVRKRVPADLAHVERRDQVRLSLETSDRKVAVSLYPFKLAEIVAEFERLRLELKERGHLSAALAQGRLEVLGRKDIEKLVTEWWDGRRAVREPATDEYDNSREAIDDISEHDRFLESSVAAGEDPYARVADRLLVDAGFAARPVKVGKIRTRVTFPVVDRSTASYRYLCEIVGRALRMEGALANDHVLHQHNAPFDPLFNPAGDKLSGQVVASQTGTVGDLIREYRAEREELYGKESTDRKYGLLFRVMEDVLGHDLPAHRIDRSRCIELLNFLRRLPPNATKRFPLLTLSEAVALAEKDDLAGLAPNTVASYMQNLNALLKWAGRNKWGVQVDTEKLFKARGAQVRRRGFRTNELSTLFNALGELKDSKPTKFWVPALALLTGARAGEICQLRTEDVVEVDGIWCLDLSEFDAQGQRTTDKRLKTKASERFVPLHRTLHKAGFLDFVARRGQDQRLFPDLLPGPKDSYSHNFSKWFGRFMDRVGLTERSLVFHSFRHGFRDACRQADIAEDTALALGGWASIDQASRYGDRGLVSCCRFRGHQVRLH